MIEDFIPLPQVGHRYVTHDKMFLTVTGVTEVDGVILVYASGLDGQRFEFNANQWNELDLSNFIIINREKRKSFSCQELEDEYKRILEEINGRRSEGKALKWKCGILNEFFWRCAGVDCDLLRTCKHDWTSKAGLGATVFMISVLIAMSIGYALSLIVQNMFFVFAISILFWLLVFSLGRFAIASMYSDGKASISLKELMSGLPHIIIAIFLGLVVAIPIEMLLFRSTIDDYIYDEKTKAVLTSPEVVSIDERLESARNVIAYLDSCIQRYSAEYDKRCSIVYDMEHNPIRSITDSHVRLLENKIYAAKKEIEILRHEQDSLSKAKSEIVSHAPNTGEASLSQNIEALHAVTDHGVNFMMRILVSLLFVLLLITPILSIMMANGVYDMILSKEKEIIKRIIDVRE